MPAAAPFLPVARQGAAAPEVGNVDGVMAGRQRILPVRRDYNRWVANQTLEDYALRFTAKSSRRWASGRVAQTAIGAISPAKMFSASRSSWVTPIFSTTSRVRARALAP